MRSSGSRNCSRRTALDAQRTALRRTSKNRDFVNRRETSSPFLGLIVRIRSASPLPRSDCGGRCDPSSRVDEALSRLKVCPSKCRDGMTAPIRFLFVDIAALRAKQLRRGAKARVTKVWRTSERVAMEEVSRGLVDYHIPGPENGAEGQ